MKINYIHKASLKSILYYFLSFINSLINYLFIILVIKKYGLKVYGEYSLVINIIMAFVSLSSGMLSQTIWRFNTKSSSFKSLIYDAYIYILIFTIPIFIGINLFLFDKNIFITVSALIIFVLFSVSSIINSFYYSEHDVYRQLLFDLIRMSFSALVLLFIPLENSYLGLYPILITLILTISLSFSIFKKNDFIHLAKSYTRSFVKLDSIYEIFYKNKKIFKYGFIMSCWIFIYNCINTIDRFFIREFLTTHDLGIYSAINDTVTKAINFVFNPILLIGYTYILKNIHLGKINESYKIIKIMLIIEIIIILILIISIKIILKYLTFFGLIENAFLDNPNLIYILVLSSCIWHISMIIQKLYELNLNILYLLISIAISLIINVILNYIFISKYGLMAAAGSYLFASIFYLFLIVPKKNIYLKHAIAAD